MDEAVTDGLKLNSIGKKLVDAGFVKVSNAAAITNAASLAAAHEHLQIKRTMPANASVLVVDVAHEADEDIDIYFDDFNLEVQEKEANIIQEDSYYPFGLSFNSHTMPSISQNKFLYNGKEKQEETGWFDYGARMYDPLLIRFISIDPAVEHYSRWTPFNYVMNNPLIYIDPTGMFTEIYNKNGKKIGEDKEGKNDGNVSIVTNNKKAKEIEKSYKNGEVASQEDVESGIQTTKAVLNETIDVLGRTKKNGGLREEVSVVTEDNKVVKGKTGPMPKVEIINGTETMVADATIPKLPKGKTASKSTVIHSHPLEIYEENGKAYPQSASLPSDNDRKAFKAFGMAIIVGKLGKLHTVKKKNGKIEDTRQTGAVIYDSNTKQKAQLTIRALKRMAK